MGKRKKLFVIVSFTCFTNVSLLYIRIAWENNILQEKKIQMFQHTTNIVDCISTNDRYLYVQIVCRKLNLVVLLSL